MSPDPLLVVLAGLVTSSPALWRLAHGQLTLDQTLVRCGIAFAACWLAVSIVAAIAFPAGRRPEVPVEERTPVE